MLGSFKQLAVDQTSSQRRRFDLHELMQEIALTMRPAIRRTAHQLHCTIPPQLELESYPGPLGQVLMNLIANALTHAFAAGVAGNIWVQAWLCDDDCVRLVVSDDGCGIPAKQQKRVFDPFFTTKLGKVAGPGAAHCLYPGHGLAGGRIALESYCGQGSRFTLELPRAPPCPALAPRRMRHRRRPHAPIKGAGRHP